MIGLALKISLLVVFLIPLMKASEALGQAEPPGLKLTVVFNNEPCDSSLETSWGFGCVVEGLDETILFDTGGDGKILLANMDKLEIDPGVISMVVLSHYHGDHTGGLSDFLRRNPRVAVWLPESFPDSFQASIRSAGAEVKTVGGPTGLFDGVHSTGEMGSSIIEQSLVLDTSRGLVVITGCAHPGIAGIVRKAGRLLNKRIYLVVGGFHLNSMTADEINGVIREFKEMGVQRVGATHCTGDQAIKMFRQAWGDDFVESGCGAVIELPR